MIESEDRLSRWSRRKMKARRGRPEADPEDILEPAETPLVEQPETELSPEEEAEVLRRLDLPEPESLKAGDDFSRFLQSGVPDQIRRKALRLLWRSNPILANVDGLVDYGEDFTDAATVIENLKTVFVVGHGARPIEVEEDEPQLATGESSTAGTDGPPLPERDSEADELDDESGTTEANRILGPAEETEPLEITAQSAGEPDPAELGVGSEPLPQASVRRGMTFRFDS